MSIETTENFWEALSALEPVVQKPIIYRLYYDDSGNPLFYSMEELPGNYIDIDRETYHEGSNRVKVVDGKLVKVEVKFIIQKLIPSDEGIPCSRSNICIIADQSETHIKWKQKE